MSWLTTKVTECHGSSPSSTTVLVVTQGDYDSISADVIGPCAGSDDFKADLKLHKSCWFYHASTQKRCLLLLAEGDAAIKDMRGLGKKAATELQSKKINSVHFFLSSSIQNLKQGAGHFINKFDDCNYELSWKRPLEEEKKTEDTRTHRHEKNVETYTLHVEDESILSSDEYKFQLAAARAQSTCKRLERTRGSEADPVWMAAEA